MSGPCCTSLGAVLVAKVITKVSNYDHRDIPTFCCVRTQTLPDGRIVVTGGESSLRTSIYDPVRS